MNWCAYTLSRARVYSPMDRLATMEGGRGVQKEERGKE